MPIRIMMIETIIIKIKECITALFASSILLAPRYREIKEFAPAPIPIPIPIMTIYRGVINPNAARASVFIPETQKLSIILFKNIKSIEKIVGKANLLIAFLGFPIIVSILELLSILINNKNLIYISIQISFEKSRRYYEKF
jgi:hypothetical protein